MKLFQKISTFIIGVVLILNFSTCGNAQTKANIKEAKIKVFFHCPNGQALIQQELPKEPGVQSVVADLETKIVTISYDASMTDQDKLVAAIEKIGYSTEFTKEDKPINKACTHENPPTQ
jgi:copper chaperone CopZ